MAVSTPVPHEVLLVDALNLCLYNKEKPSLDALLTLLIELAQRGISFLCMFDGVSPHRLPEDQRAHYRLLVANYSQFFAEVTGGVEADEFILLQSNEEGCKIITNDQYRKYYGKYSWLTEEQRLIKWNVAGGSFQVAGLRLHVPIQRNIQQAIDRLRSLLDLQSGTHQKPSSGRPRARVSELTPSETGYSFRGRLIVFVLDASASMWNPSEGAANTYDGRLKSEHLNEILRGAIMRLGQSGARNSLYFSVINFAGKPNVREFLGKPLLNAREAVESFGNIDFNYRDGVTGNGTDLAAALRAAREVIDGALKIPSNLDLHDEWHALVILFTDGRHTGDTEDVRKIARQTAISHSTLPVGNVRTAAVGIGTDCDAKLMAEIATEADSVELSMLKKAQLDSFLLDKKLVVMVSEKSDRYVEVIRKFVDIVTETIPSG